MRPSFAILIAVPALIAGCSSDGTERGPGMAGSAEAGGKADGYEDGGPFEADAGAYPDGGELLADGAAEPAADPWADARDPDLALVRLPEDLAAPESYDYPDVDRFALNGTEFWQRWSGGHSPTFSFSEGTEQGRRCMQASAIRFETIVGDPPEGLIELLEGSEWGGSFFNWNDDYTRGTSDGTGARLWAWRTGLVKWISQTNRDGSCYLPTRAMVDRLIESCLATAESTGGEIQGCRGS